MMAVLPKNHHLSALKAVPLEALAEEPFVLLAREREPGFYEQVVRACQEAGFVLRVAQEVTEMQVGLGLGAAGAYVGLLPASTRHIKMTGVVFKKLAKPVPKMTLYIAWRRGNLPPVARAFLDLAEEVAGRQTVRS
jgi:DNA-binding transcriptional LysR family regulator